MKKVDMVIAELCAKMERAVDAGDVETAEEIDALAADLANESGYEDGSEEFDAVYDALTRKAAHEIA